MPILRVLAIGAGVTSSRVHLPILSALQKEGKVELLVIADIHEGRAEEARTTFGFREATTNAAAAIERQDIDIVYVFGTARMHYDFGCQALHAGKHLFVEKPVAPSSAELSELVALAEEKKLVAVGGYNRRFFASFLSLEKKHPPHEWRLIEAVFHKPSYGKPVPYGASSWLTSNAVHSLDALVFMAGSAPSFLASNSDALSTDIPVNFSALMRWPDGRQALFAANNTSASKKEQYVFHGIESTFTADDSALVSDSAGSSDKQVFTDVDDNKGFRAEHVTFLDAIREGNTAPRHSLASAVDALKLAELIESGYTGTIEKEKPSTSKVTTEKSIERREKNAGTTLLVLNPDAIRQNLGVLTGYTIVTLSDVRSMNESKRKDIVGVITDRVGGSVPEDVLSLLPNIKVAGIIGLSVKKYNPETLLAKGIPIVNATDAYADAVAEFGLMAGILGRRRASLSYDTMRAGGWGTRPVKESLKSVLRTHAQQLRQRLKDSPVLPLLKSLWQTAKPAIVDAKAGSVAPDVYKTRSFAGSSVGLIGWGSNAKAFARLARMHGAKVFVFSEHAKESDVSAHSAEKRSLSEVLKCDIVSVHRGLTDATRHSIGERELSQLRSGAVFINLARGGIVDTDALVVRMKQGDIVACLDVFEEEPLPKKHPLRSLPNVFLTSHIAGSSKELSERAATEVAKKVVAYLNGEEVERINSVERLRTMT